MTIPTALEYEERERRLHHAKLREVEAQSASDKREAARDWLHALNTPGLVAERISWLLNGSYGYGSYQAALAIAGNKRLNRTAALSQMIAAYEWLCPQRLAIGMWKQVGIDRQTALNFEIEEVINQWESELEAEALEEVEA